MADVGEIRARLVLDSTGFSAAMLSAQSQMNNMNHTALQTSNAINKIQKAALAFGAAVGAVFVASVASAANFEQKMQDVKAVSGASADQMLKLSDLAKEMGKTTAFSAAEAAGGIEELIKAGVSVEQILNGGLTGALNLATAGGLQLAEAAEIASTALNAFKADNLSVAQAADILAGAANASATDVGELKYALSMVSAVASGVGMNFKDTNTALAVFAQNGLKGSDSGTSLKTMLLNLSPITKKAKEEMIELGLATKDGKSAFYDANGSIKSMAEIAELLHTKLAHLSDQQRQTALKIMFGTDAIRAANILYKEGAAGINNMWTEMSKVTAAEVAATKMDSLKGSFIALKSALESAGIQLGEKFLPILTQVARQITGFLSSLDEADMANITAALAFAGTAAAIALVGSSIAKLVISLRTLFVAMGPAGWLITGLSLIGGLFAAAALHQKEMNKVSLENAESMLKQADSLSANIKQYDELKAKSKLSNEELGRFVDINSEISKTADPNVIARLREEQDKLREKSGLSNEELDIMVQLNNDLIEKVPEATTHITNQGNAILESTDKVKAYNKEQYERIRLELEAQKAKAEANASDLLTKESEELKRINGLKEKLGGFDSKEIEQRRKIKGLYDDLATAKANNDSLEIDRINATIEREEHKLGAIAKQRAETAGLLVERTKEMDKIQEQIGKLDEVKRKMVDLELKQAGINAKRGEEIKTIDSAIAKLEEQKKELEKSVPVNQRNTAEYREARDAIQAQIEKLQGTKTKVEEIIGKAQQMNLELGKDISKTIYQRTVASNDYNNYKANALKYHMGGITGREPLPKLHVGGPAYTAAASLFASMPAHNEVDVRLLKNEAVLTEAQQANLMRIIDAGFSNVGNQGLKDSEVYRLLEEIKSAIQNGLNATIMMDSREVGVLVEPHVTQTQEFNEKRKGRF